MRTGQPGVAVDAQGGGVVDPTTNVKDLMAASLEALAQLRVADKELNTVKAAHLKEIADLRAEHAKELRANDTERSVAIRQVDITNGNSAATETQRAIQALAKTTEDTRKTLADQMAVRDTRYDERLRLLEGGANKDAGKQQVSDPAMALLAENVAALVRSQSAGKGMEKLWGWIVGAAAIGLMLLDRLKG